jgi:transposase
MAQRLKERRVESAAMESTGVYWIPTADLLEANGIEAVLVDVREVRVGPGRKSGVQDCQWLQKLHGCGLPRGAFRPPEAVAAARSILREKENLTATRAQPIRQMQKSLDQMNIRVRRAVSGLGGKTGAAIVKAIAEGERNPARLAALRGRRCQKSEKEIAGRLAGARRGGHPFNPGRAFNALQFLDERIAGYDAKAARMFSSLAAAAGVPGNLPPPPLPGTKPAAKERPNAAGKANAQQFTGFDTALIPGIGYDTATVITSELGTKFDRFPDEHHFASYIGLAPSLGKSAGKNVRQKRCKNTPRAGRALRMAASSLYRSQTELGAFFRNVARRADKKTAIKATARRMAHMIYRGVKYGKEYIDRGAEAYEARLRVRTVKTVNKLIKSFNINSSEIAAALVAV